MPKTKCQTVNIRVKATVGIVDSATNQHVLSMVSTLVMESSSRGLALYSMHSAIGGGRRGSGELYAPADAHLLLVLAGVKLRPENLPSPIHPSMYLKYSTGPFG